MLYARRELFLDVLLTSKLTYLEVVGYGKASAVLEYGTCVIVDSSLSFLASHDGDVLANVALETWCDDGLEEGASEEVATHVEVDVLVVACELIARLEH